MEPNPKYAERLQQMHRLIDEIGVMTLKGYRHAQESVQANDGEKILQLPFDDDWLQKQTSELDNTVIATIALFGEHGADLRRLVVYSKIAHALRKLGEGCLKFSKKIAAHLLPEFEATQTFADLNSLMEHTVRAIEKAMETTSADEETYNFEEALKQVLAEESQTDELFDKVHQDIILDNYKEDRYVRASIDIFNAIRRLERAADNAADIAHFMIYVKKGGRIEVS